MAVEPIPCGPDGGGTPGDVIGCCSPSIASAPLCRQDGSSVLLVVRSGCAECGETAPNPEVVGWIDANSGVFTPGPAPADAGPCDAGCVDTVCVTRCDDTDGDGAADTTYSELWCVKADGTTELVLTYSGDPSTPYTPVSPVECEYGCPESETLLLCDATGAFLRRYTWLNGTATFEDVELDGQTPHVVTGTVGACAGGGGTPLPENDLLQLCDTAADGTVTSFVRDYQRDAAGAVTGYVDYTLDGAAYTPAGTIGTCAADEGPCRDTSTLLLCDVPQDGTPAATSTDTDPTPYYPYPTGAPFPGGGQVLWDGGTLTIPAATGPQPGTIGTVATLAAAIQAARPACDDGTVHVTVSVHVAQTGPDDGCGATGHLRLFNGPSEADQIAVSALPNNTPVGWAGVLTVEADVPAADLAAGNLAVGLALDTYDNNPSACTDAPRETSWQLSSYTADVAYDQDGCITQFLRNVVTDCETGQVQSVTDTTLTGEPYTVVGEPGQCAPAGGECCEEKPCRNTNSLLLCDMPEGGEPSPTVTDTDPSAYFGAPTVPVPNGGDALWSGGTLTIPADTSVQPGHNSTVRTLAARIQAPRPVCDTGTATIAVTVDVEQLGPDDGCTATGFLFLFDGTTAVTEARPPENTPVGWTGPLTIQADVPAEALAGGDLAVVLGFDTYEDQQSVCPGPRQTSWELSGFATTVAYDQTGCEKQFLRNVTVDCETGGVVSVTDTTLDGQPYIVVGEPGQCAPVGGTPPEPCRDTSTLLVCDVPQDGEPDPTVTDTSPTPYETQAGTEPVAGGAAALWSGSVLTIQPDTAPPPDGNPQFLRTVAATVQAPRPACDTGTATVTATLRAERTGPDAGCFGTAFVQFLVGGSAVSGDSVVYDTPVGHVEVLTLTAEVPAADLAAGNVALYGAWETYHRGPSGCPGTNADGAAVGGWVLDQFSSDVVYDQEGCASQVLANVVTDCETGVVQSVTYTTTGGEPYTPIGEIGECQPTAGGDCCPQHEAVVLCDFGAPDESPGDWPAESIQFVRSYHRDTTGAITGFSDTTLDGQPYAPAGEVGACDAETPPCDAQNIIEACRCDDTDGDGFADTDYVELLAVNCDGVLTSIGTYTFDLSAPYTPVSPIECDLQGAEPVTTVQARRVQLTPGQSWDATAYPTLQSVTATAFNGEGEVTTTDGTTTLYSTETASWSVVRDDDALLRGPLSIAATTGTVSINYTLGVTL